MTVRQTLAVAQIIPQYRQTQGQGKRRLLTPDEVLRLPSNELLCIIRGCNMLKLEKLDYVKHPMSKRICKTSVMDYCPVQDTYFTLQTEPGRKEEKQEPAKPKKTLYNLARVPEEF